MLKGVVIMKVWTVSEVDKGNAKRISEDFNVPLLPAILLDVKKFEDNETLWEFLSSDADFSDPYLMTDMDFAVERINTAVRNKEKICIYGDYDADGVTSTALLYSYLESIGADVTYYIPSRETEGYGMNKNAIQVISDSHVNLIITVDNGISAYEEVEYANSLGIDVVITDHHVPPEKLPNAVAIVDQHRKDDTSPFKDFSGVGIVFKLVMALEDNDLDIEKLLDDYSDIAAIGTIGDVVSLTGENRILVREGLKRINSSKRLGIAKLRENAGTDKKDMSAVNIAFNIVPRINAGGRLGLSQRSVKLLLTDDEREAAEIAEELGEDNRKRQQIEHEILEEAIKSIESDPTVKYQKVLIVAGENWHQGVIGIVAARLKEKYGKPTIVISYSGENAKGSGRSIEGFHMRDSVAYCEDLITIFGGHPMAAGLSMPTENINAFRKRINEYADTLKELVFPKLELSCRLNPASITLEMVDSLSVLEPYGTGNQAPIFGLFEVTLRKVTPLSGGKHLKLLISKGTTELSVMYFNVTPQEFPYEIGDIINAAVILDKNYYNNREELSLKVKELSFFGANHKELLESMSVFDSYMAGKSVTNQMKSELSVNRDDFVNVYKFLRKHKGFPYAPEIMHYRLRTEPIGKMMLVLEAMKELNLITMDATQSMLNIKMVENPQKVDIMSARVLSRLFNS